MNTWQKQALLRPCELAQQCADDRYGSSQRQIDGDYDVSIRLTVNVGRE